VFDTLFLLSIFNVGDGRREKSKMKKLFIFLEKIKDKVGDGWILEMGWVVCMRRLR